MELRKSVSVKDRCKFSKTPSIHILTYTVRMYCTFIVKPENYQPSANVGTLFIVAGAINTNPLHLGC